MRLELLQQDNANRLVAAQTEHQELCARLAEEHEAAKVRERTLEGGREGQAAGRQCLGGVASTRWHTVLCLTIFVNL